MKIITGALNKESDKHIEDKIRGDKLSTPQSNPRKPETTILEDMEHIMSLVDNLSIYKRRK